MNEQAEAVVGTVLTMTPLPALRAFTRRITLSRIEAAAAASDPMVLDTLQWDWEPLTGNLGVRVVLNAEALNPVRSINGKGLIVWRRTCRQEMGYTCQARGVPNTIYAAETANLIKVECMWVIGAEVILAGVDFDAAKAIGNAEPIATVEQDPESYP